MTACQSQKYSFNVLKGQEARPEGMGQTTPITIPYCASRTPPFLMECWIATRSSQAQPHKNREFPQSPHLLHDLTPPISHLISYGDGATPSSHNHTHFTPSLPFLWPYCPHNYAGVVCTVNCRGLTFDLLLHPPRHPAGVKGHTGWGYANLSSHSWAPG